MKVRPGYKQTEVGVIPEDWKTHTIGDSLRLINGRAFKPEDWKERGLPIVRIQNLNDTESSFNYCSGPVEDRHRIETGDLLFAWSGTTGTSFGARVWNGPTAVLNQHIFKVIPDQTKLTRVYALLVLSKVQEHIEKQAHGFKASFVHVKKSDLVGVRLPLPPTKAEQEAIAEVLSDADALIDSLEQLLTKKRRLKQGAMQELLTGKKRLPGFSGEWEVVNLDGVLGRITGVWGSQDGLLTGTAQRYLSDQEFAKAHCRHDDIVITASGNGLGKVWWCDGRANVAASNFVRILRPLCGKSQGRYLSHVLRSAAGLKQLQEHTATSAYPNLRPSFFAATWISLPPISEQTAIAAILSDMDTEIAALEEKLAKARGIKHGMMQELLTGRIRLV